MVKLYCNKINRNDRDTRLDVNDHPNLDNLPRKTIGQQVEAFLLAGQNLDMSRRALFELDNYDENADVEEYDSGLDEYSDMHDIRQAQQELNEKYVQLNALRREQAMRKKQESKVEKPEQKVEKVEKVE